MCCLRTALMSFDVLFENTTMVYSKNTVLGLLSWDVDYESVLM